jgi:hypothetical protein
MRSSLAIMRVADRYFSEGQNVYYARQLEIWMEHDFFHWITKRALNELAREGHIKFKEEELQHHKAHFYYPRSHRYAHRQIGQTMGLIKEFSDPDFTRASGHHGESLLESASLEQDFV